MKPVLLLIPGLLNTAQVWQGVVAGLADVAEVRITDVTTQDSIADMARDAQTIVADVPPDRRLVICGFSMGGYIAIEMLMRDGRQADALALLGTSARPESEEGQVLREKTVAAIARDFEKVVQGVAKFGTTEATHADTARMGELMDMMRSVGPETAIRQNRAISARTDHRAALTSIRQPTLVMCGTADRITPPPLSEELVSLIPGARLEWVDDAGHMAPVEAAPRVAALLRTLL